MRNNNIGEGLGTWIHGHGPLFILIVAWSLLWSGLGLWHAAKRQQSGWFLILLFIHTFGIIEIIYLFGVLKLKASELFK